MYTYEVECIRPKHNLEEGIVVAIIASFDATSELVVILDVCAHIEHVPTKKKLLQ